MGVTRPAQAVKCAQCGKTAAEVKGGWWFMCTKCGNYTCFKCNSSNQCREKINHATCFGSRIKAMANGMAALDFK